MQKREVKREHGVGHRVVFCMFPIHTNTTMEDNLGILQSSDTYHRGNGGKYEQGIGVHYVWEIIQVNGNGIQLLQFKFVIIYSKLKRFRAFT